MKKQNYFPHDYYANLDPKLMAFDNEFGLAAYGLYWKIIERLHIEDGHRLELKDYVIRSLFQHNSTSVEQIKIMLDFAINECELFVIEDGFLYSLRVNRNIDIMADIKEKRSYAGKMSAINKNSKKNATHVEHVLTHVEQTSTQCNKIKENKIKEKEEEKNIYTATPKNLEMVIQYFAEKSYPKHEAERFFNYYNSNGWKVGKNPMKNWHSAAANWNKNNITNIQKVQNGTNKPQSDYEKRRSLDYDEVTRNFAEQEEQLRAGTFSVDTGFN